MNLVASLSDESLAGKLASLANTPADLDRMAGAVHALVCHAGLSLAHVETDLRKVLAERSFYGAYCELGAYEWFDRHHVDFAAQIELTGQDVLNPKGCIVDGRLNVIDAYFDVKGMGFQAYVADLFRQRLEQLLQGLAVTIDGAMDIAVKDIECYGFGQLRALAQKLTGGGAEKIPQLSWTIRAEPPRDITMSVHTNNPYRLAEENRYFPFKTATQFTRKRPFVLVFAYAAQFNHALFLNFASNTEITLRSLARRAFLQLTSDSTPAQRFDDQVAAGILVANAARLISGILFINLSNDDAWFFLNPRATPRSFDSTCRRFYRFLQAYQTQPH